MLEDQIATKAFFHVEDLLHVLYGRWLDERQYEDINDYAIPVRKALVGFKEVLSIKMTRKPFGFKMVINQLTYIVQFKRNKFVMFRSAK